MSGNAQSKAPNKQFRAKRIDNGEWVYGCLIKYDDGACEIMASGQRTLNRVIDGKPFYSSHSVCYDVDPHTVGEYTGIPDLKGKDMYERDIVKFLWTNDIVNMEILFKDGSYLAIPIDYPAGWPLTIFHIKDQIEVIGNAHDNPELLIL
ncbi:YopX family protein [Syntrophomonas palmitatica]|uniref:YopX family protein n=1 Tax=Syntrophomonas palmitatica TaxID=402877 RepID=UPI0006D059DE|nr:YopX family protein [Syntrophomonas palmitatica]